MESESENWIVGVDVGGTFTDFSAREIISGRSLIHKRPSTPQDPSLAVIAGLQEMIEKYDMNPRAINRFSHGTTVATNALLQRRGAKVALVTTSGFRDLVEIGRQVRPHIYDLQLDAPAPLSPRSLRFEVKERVGSQGEVICALNESTIEQLIERLRPHSDIDALAVCLLFSFLNPQHEQMLAQALRQAFPHVFVSVSSEVQPEFREFERFSTTLINAFLQPEVSRYMERLKSGVAAIAANAEFGIFQSSGGLMNVDRAAQFPVRTALSGPAAGVIGARGAAKMSYIDDIITLDIGGTSTDVCLIRAGKTALASAREISGFRIRLPMVDIHTVGAGGGSIAHLDADGLMKVGPMSAGALPGPACYNRGGQLPTVSDANVILGRLPISLTGGDMVIDRTLGVEALKPLAAHLSMGIEQTALGIIGIVTSNMVRAIRAVTIEKGYDPRKFALMPFGGAGGLHAADVAAALGIARVIIPLAPGILCAEGLILSDLREDFVISHRCRVDENISPAQKIVEDLSLKAQQWLAEAGPSSTDGRLTLSLDMRYVGQNYELLVEMPDVSGKVMLPSAHIMKQAFFVEYERAYGHYDAEAPIEIVNIRLRALARLMRADTAPVHPTGTPAPFDVCDIWFDEGGAVKTPVYERAKLPLATVIAGPALITQMDSTTLVPPWGRVTIDDALNIIMEIDND